ncbi:hypothetical protein D5275_05535 [Adlercreutzia muris]|nr:hypothetical protein [Adlercreutzia muris]
MNQSIAVLGFCRMFSGYRHPDGFLDILRAKMQQHSLFGIGGSSAYVVHQVFFIFASRLFRFCDCRENLVFVVGWQGFLSGDTVN